MKRVGMETELAAKQVDRREIHPDQRGFHMDLAGSQMESVEIQMKCRGKDMVRPPFHMEPA